MVYIFRYNNIMRISSMDIQTWVAWLALLIWCTSTHYKLYQLTQDLEDVQRTIQISQDTYNTNEVRNQTWEPSNNIMSASLDNIVNLPPASLQFPYLEYDINRYTELHPALHTQGLIYAGGDVVTTGSVLFQAKPGHFVNLSQWWNDYTEMNEACGLAPFCIHGTVNPITCNCKCELEWEDDSSENKCSKHTCNGRGTWNSDIQRCECDSSEHTSESNCGISTNVHEPPTNATLSPDHCNGAGYHIESVDKCGCTTPGVLDAICDPASECAIIERDNEKCPNRLNWGTEFNGTGNTFFACGGGYLYGSATTVRIKGLRCNEGADCGADFSQDKHICCSPGIACDAHHSQVCSKPDATCCANHTSSEWVCLNAGCAWCGTDASGNNVCAPREHASTCKQPALLNTLQTTTGIWMSWTYDCSTDNPATNICNRAVRDEYLGYYRTYCSDEGVYKCTSAHLKSAYNYINYQATWPSLDATGNPVPQTPMQVALHTLALTTCPTAMVLSVQPQSPYASLGAPAIWKCPSDASISDYTVWLVDVGSGAYLFAQHILKQYTYCLGKEGITPEIKAVLFGDELIGPPNLAYWRNVQETSGWYMNLENLCNIIQYDAVSLNQTNARIVSTGSNYLSMEATTHYAEWAYLGLAVDITSNNIVVSWQQ